MSKSLSAFMRPNVAEIKNASFAPSPRLWGGRQAGGVGNPLHLRR